METMEAIFSRRSSRKFLDKALPKGVVEQILRAGMQAPSARNQQPWHFVAVSDRGLLDRIPDVHPHASMCLEAPLAIVCCGDPGLSRGDAYWVQDVSAASQNILLAARDLGLGAVWLGVYPMMQRVQAIRELFNLPDSVIPLNIIALGYTEVPQRFVDRYLPERVHQNTW